MNYCAKTEFMQDCTGCDKDDVPRPKLGCEAAGTGAAQLQLGGGF